MFNVAFRFMKPLRSSLHSPAVLINFVLFCGGWLTFLCLMAGCNHPHNPASAAPTEQPIAAVPTGQPSPTGPLYAAVRFTDGSRLVGEVEDYLVLFRSTLAGEIRLSLHQILLLERGSPNTKFFLTTTNGDRLQGTLVDTRLHLRGAFGEVQASGDQILRFEWQPHGSPATGWLVSRWSAEGNAQDSIGGHHGELLFGARTVPGKLGNAFRFEDERARVHVPDAEDFEQLRSFTVEAWVVTIDPPTDNGCGIICTRDDNRPGLATWLVCCRGEGEIVFWFTDAANNKAEVSAPAPVGEWFHVAAVFDEPVGRMTLYINGKPAATDVTKIKPIRHLEAAEEAGIGIGNDSGRRHVYPFRGVVDELGIHSKALAPEEIQDIYASGAQ